MPKSDFAVAVDSIQQALRPLLKTQGFKARARSFNRVTEDHLTQVVSIQMGASDPPGTTYFPGLRENLHGLFTVNLGVYVPEVAKYHGGGEARSWVQEYHCCVRARLGAAADEAQDIWWHARADDAVIEDVKDKLERFGVPFLERFATRDKILSEWHGISRNVGAGSPPRIVMAIILAQRGQKEEARQLLAQQVLETHNPRHPEYVRKLASELLVGNIDG